MQACVAECLRGCGRGAPAPKRQDLASGAAKWTARCRWSGCRTGCRCTGEQARNRRAPVSVLTCVTARPTCCGLHRPARCSCWRPFAALPGTTPLEAKVFGCGVASPAVPGEPRQRQGRCGGCEKLEGDATSAARSRRRRLWDSGGAPGRAEQRWDVKVCSRPRHARSSSQGLGPRKAVPVGGTQTRRPAPGSRSKPRAVKCVAGQTCGRPLWRSSGRAGMQRRAQTAALPWSRVQSERARDRQDAGPQCVRCTPRGRDPGWGDSLAGARCTFGLRAEVSDASSHKRAPLRWQNADPCPRSAAPARALRGLRRVVVDYDEAAGALGPCCRARRGLPSAAATAARSRGCS